MSDEREMLDDGSGQLIDRAETEPEAQDEGEDFEGHQLEVSRNEDLGPREAGRNEDLQASRNEDLRHEDV